MKQRCVASASLADHDVPHPGLALLCNTGGNIPVESLHSVPSSFSFAFRHPPPELLYLWVGVKAAGGWGTTGCLGTADNG